LVVDVYPSLEDALKKKQIITDADGFIPVKEYAVLWKPKIKEREEAYGRVYIRNSRPIRSGPGNGIPNHYPKGSCPTPGCTKLHGWTSFRVDDPQEVSTILDILRNEPGIKFNPETYAIASYWNPTKPKAP
jgi:hypothetical protein